MFTTGPGREHPRPCAGGRWEEGSPPQPLMLCVCGGWGWGLAGALTPPAPRLPPQARPLWVRKGEAVSPQEDATPQRKLWGLVGGFVSLWVCVCVSLCIFVYLYVSVYVCVVVSICMSACLFLCMSVYMCGGYVCVCVYILCVCVCGTCVCICVSVHTYLYICLGLYLCVYVSIYIFVCLSTCMCVWVFVYVCGCASVAVFPCVCTYVSGCVSMEWGWVDGPWVVEWDHTASRSVCQKPEGPPREQGTRCDRVSVSDRSLLIERSGTPTQQARLCLLLTPPSTVIIKHPSCRTFWLLVLFWK